MPLNQVVNNSLKKSGNRLNMNCKHIKSSHEDCPTSLIDKGEKQIHLLREKSYLTVSIFTFCILFYLSKNRSSELNQLSFFPLYLLVVQDIGLTYIHSFT